MNTYMTERRAAKELETDIHALETRVQALELKIDRLNSSIEDLVYAWQTGQGVVKFVKWLGVLAGAIAAIVFLLKYGSHK